MKKREFFLFVCLSSLIGCSAILSYPQVKRGKSTREMAGCIRDPSCMRTFVVAHRGNGFGAPENSREAMIRAVSSDMVDVIETDIRYSKDHKWFILHDRDLERTTTAEGALSQRTADELKKIYLKGSGESVPSFEELYAITRGKVILDLDFKNNAIEEIADWISLHGSFDDVIFYASSKDEISAAARAKEKYPLMMVLAEYSKEKNATYLAKAFNGKLPEILHIHFPMTLTCSDMLHSYHVKLFADSLAVPPPLDIIALEVLFSKHIDFIEVNHPAFLASLL